MTVELDVLARRIAEILRKRIDRRIPVSSNLVVREVYRDSTGQAYAAAVDIGEGTPQYVTVPYGAQISPGTQIMAVNYGTDSNPYWVMISAKTGFETPGVMVFPEDTVIGSASFHKGDAIFGRADKSYLLYEASEGDISAYSGSDPVLRLLSGSGKVISERSGSTIAEFGETEAGWGLGIGLDLVLFQAVLSGSQFEITLSNGNTLIYDSSGSIAGALLGRSGSFQDFGNLEKGTGFLGEYPAHMLSSSGKVLLRSGSEIWMSLSSSGIDSLRLAFWPSASEDAVTKEYVDSRTASAPGPGYFQVSVGSGSFQALRPLLNASGQWLIEENSFLLLMADER